MTCIETVVNLLVLISSIVFIDFGPSVYTKGSHKKKTTKFWTSSKHVGGGVSGAAKPFIEKRYGQGGRGVKGPRPK